MSTQEILSTIEAVSGIDAGEPLPRVYVGGVME